MAITFKINRSRDLTTFKARGAVTFEDVMGAIKLFYDGQVTRYALWDFGDATVWDLRAQDVETLAAYPARVKRGVEDKTAIVASDTMTRAMSELFLLFQESSTEVKVRVRLFEQVSEAMAWLFP